MSIRRPLQISAAALLAVLLLTVVLLETVPRWVAVPGLTLHELDPVRLAYRTARIEPHPYLAYVPKPGFANPPGAQRQISHNSLGFRGPEITLAKPPGVLRVVCLGGSSTYGHGPSSDATTWPGRLEVHLTQLLPGRQIQVVNGGCQGWSSFELLGNLAFRVLELKPDLVIVYETINDMRCALYPDPKPDNTHWRAVWRPLPEHPLADSITWLAWRRYFTTYRPGDLGTFVIRDFDGKSDKYAWTPASEQGFRNTYRNLHSIISLAEANGARVLLGTQALRREDVQRINPDSAADQLRAFDYLTAVIRRVAQERGVSLADPQRALASHLEQQRAQRSGGDSLFTSEVHVTDEGADLIARTFAEAIVGAGLLEER
jgi:lysophospholipase L1-like esterase